MSNMWTVIYQVVKKKHHLTRLVKAKLEFNLRNLKPAIYMFSNILEALPVEIWCQLASFMRIIDVFYFFCASKSIFEVCNRNETFKSKKRISKHIVSFDFEIFNFFKSKLEFLSGNIQKMLKDTIYI